MKKQNKLIDILNTMDWTVNVKGLLIQYNLNSFIVFLPYSHIKNLDKLEDILKRFQKKRILYNQKRSMESYIQQWVFANRFQKHYNWIIFKEDINWLQKIIYKIFGRIRKDKKNKWMIKN